MLGTAGGLERCELCKLTTENVEDTGSMLLVRLSQPITNNPRAFMIDGGTDKSARLIDIYRRYMSIRPVGITSNRLFLNYRNGGCTSNPVGINAFGKIPREIATYLGLRDVEGYTGHSFRMTYTYCKETNENTASEGGFIFKRIH